MPLPSFIHVKPDGVLLSVKLQPRASVNEIVPVPVDSGELRVRVSAPPVDDAANAALIRFLAEWLDCPRNRIELIQGHKSRHKVIKLHGFTAEEFLMRF